MIIKMLCTFDFNPETNEYKPIGTPEIIKDTPKKTITESSEPELVRLDSKYTLNQAAVDLLQVQPGDRLNINYDNHPDNPNLKVPIIGSNKSWGNDLGNKLTKSLTVSYRGVANTVLADYGTTFKLVPFKEGLFMLKGDKDIVLDDNVEVKDTPDLEPDLIPDLEQIEEDIINDEDFLEPENFEIVDVDFNFDQNEL